MLIRWINRVEINRHAMLFPTFEDNAHALARSESDYFRYATIALHVQRVLTEGIQGAFAELGVYKGVTSHFIHSLAPDRQYYLFDTFEGFPSTDLEVSSDTRFRDTSLDSVLERIGNIQNVIPCKGYVPDTLAGLEDETFAFVLFDMDLYKPTVAGLEFFYPRVSPGGYLMVHDYNSPESDWACRRAVDGFMAGKQERIIEIPDKNGSVLFRKI